MTAYRRLHTFQARGSMRAWLAGIARRVAFRWRRTDERRQRRNDSLSPPPPSEDLERWLARKEAEAFLEGFLAGLDNERRDVFVLCDLEGLRGREAAAALGVNQNTAYARLRSARTSFERACQRVQGDGVDIDAGRVRAAHEEQPPTQAAQRGWAALLVQTGLAGSGRAVATSASTVAWSASAKVLALTVLVGSLGLAVVRRALPVDDPGPGVEPVVVDRDEGSNPVPRVFGGANDARVEAPPATIAAAPGSPAPAPSVAVPRLAPPPTSGPNERPDRRPTPRPRSEGPNEKAGMSLVELEQLDRARAALSAGRPTRAAQLAAAFVQTHAASALLTDARVLLVRAHCVAGRHSEALRAAARLSDAERNATIEKFCAFAPRKMATAETSQER